MFAFPDEESNKKRKKKDGSKQSLGEWVPTMKGLIIKNYKSLTCPEIWKIIHRCGARWWVEIGLPLLYFFPFSDCESKLKQSISTCQSAVTKGGSQRDSNWLSVPETNRWSSIDYVIVFQMCKFNDNFTAFVISGKKAKANKVRLKSRMKIIKNEKSLTCPGSSEIIHRWAEVGFPLLYLSSSKKQMKTINFGFPFKWSSQQEGSSISSLVLGALAWFNGCAWQRASNWPKCWQSDAPRVHPAQVITPKEAPHCGPGGFYVNSLFTERIAIMPP